MSNLADLLNAPAEVTYKGKTYPLRELTFAERAVLSRRLERRAEEALGRAFGRMPREAWDAWAARVAAEIAAGVYEFGGEAYARALTTIDGMAYTLFLALKDSHEEVTEEFAGRLVSDLVGERLLTQLETIQKAGADPGNSSAPAGRSPRPGTSSKSSATSRSRKRRKK